MAAAFSHVLKPIRDGAEFTLYCERQRGDSPPVLVVAIGTQPPSQSVRRREHRYSLVTEHEHAGAATAAAAG